jgi:hypothetical protein
MIAQQKRERSGSGKVVKSFNLVPNSKEGKK